VADPDPDPAAKSPERLDRLRDDLARVGPRDAVSTREQWLARAGAVLLALGPIWAAVEYFVSHSGHNSLQQRDAIIGALFGLTLSVAGAALFLRYSGGRLLRLWMARSALVTEQQHADLLAAVRDTVPRETE
jgi:hypothetical protein